MCVIIEIYGQYAISVKILLISNLCENVHFHYLLQPLSIMHIFNVLLLPLSLGFHMSLVPTSLHIIPHALSHPLFSYHNNKDTRKAPQLFREKKISYRQLRCIAHPLWTGEGRHHLS